MLLRDSSKRGIRVNPDFQVELSDKLLMGSFNIFRQEGQKKEQKLQQKELQDDDDQKLSVDRQKAEQARTAKRKAAQLEHIHAQKRAKLLSSAISNAKKSVLPNKFEPLQIKNRSKQQREAQSVKKRPSSMLDFVVKHHFEDVNKKDDHQQSQLEKHDHDELEHSDNSQRKLDENAHMQEDADNENVQKQAENNLDVQQKKKAENDDVEREPEEEDIDDDSDNEVQFISKGVRDTAEKDVKKNNSRTKRRNRNIPINLYKEHPWLQSQTNEKGQRSLTCSV